MARRRTRRQALPPIPRKADPELRQYLQSLQEITDTGEGTRGDPLDRKLTIRDLVEAGIAKVKAAAGYIDGSSLQPSADSTDPRLSQATPPRPVSVNFVPVIGSLVISWLNPAEQYINHAYTEIWRSETSDFTEAVRIGTSQGSSFPDYTAEGGETYWYWIRFKSIADRPGPWHDNAGTEVQTVRSARLVLADLNEEFADTPPSAGEPGRDFIIDASRFAVRIGETDNDKKLPFAVLQDGTVIMQNVRVDEGILGPISFGKIVDAEGNPVTNVAGKLKATQLESDKLNITGDSTFSGILDVKSASSGGRLEIKNNTIKVFDSSNNLRVHIGDLNA